MTNVTAARDGHVNQCCGIEKSASLFNSFRRWN